MTTNIQHDLVSIAPAATRAHATALAHGAHSWLVDKLGSDDFVVQAAFPDTSDKQYFRITIAGETRVLIDASSMSEDYLMYSQVSALLRAAQVNAPEVHAEDCAKGFFLISDVGRETYSAALNEGNADLLFRDARAALINWQLASRPDILPTCDAALLRRELAHFSDGYITKRLGITLTPDQQQMLARVFNTIVAANLAQASVYVHRDYVPGNLLVANANPGVLGFQGAMFGAISYDIASLYKDVSILCDQERILDGTVRYWESAKKAHLPVPADFGDFYRDADWMGLQRHLTLLGALGYSSDEITSKEPEQISRLIRHIRQVGERYVALFPLIRLFDKLNINDGVPRTVGVSF